MRRTNVDRVVEALYWKSKEMNVKELIKDTGLNAVQIYSSLYLLKSLSLVRKRLVIYSEGKSVIHVELFAKLINPTNTEKFLRKRGIIN